MRNFKKYFYVKLKQFSKHHVPSGLILLIDALFCLFALIISFLLIKSSTVFFEDYNYYLLTFGSIFFIQFMSIYAFRSYLGIVRYTNLRDAFKQITSCIIHCFFYNYS